MTISNEPGYYENGNFGIRIENICVSTCAKTPFNFGGKKFLQFEDLTLVPMKTDLINLDMMDNEELAWLNNYHTNVREKLLPLMRETFPESVDYLVAHTEAIVR